MIWKERNNRIFDRQAKTSAGTLAWVIEEILAWYQAGFKRLEPVVLALGALGALPGRTFAVL